MDSRLCGNNGNWENLSYRHAATISKHSLDFKSVVISIVGRFAKPVCCIFLLHPEFSDGPGILVEKPSENSRQ